MDDLLMWPVAFWRWWFGLFQQEGEPLSARTLIAFSPLIAGLVAGILIDTDEHLRGVEFGGFSLGLGLLGLVLVLALPAIAVVLWFGAVPFALYALFWHSRARHYARLRGDGKPTDMQAAEAEVERMLAGPQ